MPSQPDHRPRWPYPSPRASDPRAPRQPRTRTPTPRPRAPSGSGCPGPFGRGKWARNPRTQWVRGSIEKSGENRGIPGEKCTQWVRKKGSRGRGDKSAFRAQEAFDRVLLKKHLFSGFPKTDPLRQKGHLSLAYNQLTNTLKH